MTDLDPRHTFDNFVVGPANRLASAAARRAAEAPGTSYNPLFIYAASGLGKSHILGAIAHRFTRAHPERRALYQTLEVFLGELTNALGSGEREAMRKRYQELNVLLLDDVQFLAGQPEAQEMLLSVLDFLTMSGSQIVLASDRPPSDIDKLDARLLSRFSAGLIVDIGSPEYETRVAILRRKLQERHASLQAGVAETLARIPFRNVRELQGGLNRILAIQDLEERAITSEEALRLIQGSQGVAAEPHAPPPDSLHVTSVAYELHMAEAPWRVKLRGIAARAESWGFLGTRLQRIADAEEPPGLEELNSIVQSFKRDIQRLRDVRSELDRVGNPWPEAATALLKDPERLDEADSLLASAKERQRPFPSLRPGPRLSDLAEETTSLAVRAAERLVLSEPPDYNPLFLACSNEDEGILVLEAAGRSFLQARPEGRAAFTSAVDFAEDFIRALSAGVAGAWRERWWTVELLLLHGVQKLSETERAQEELFHLFEALKRRGARIFLASDRSPSAIGGIDDRLRSRFEGGLVVEVERGSVPRRHPGLREGPDQAEDSVPIEGPVSLPPVRDLDWGEFGDDELFTEEELTAAPPLAAEVEALTSLAEPVAAAPVAASPPGPVVGPPARRQAAAATAAPAKGARAPAQAAPSPEPPRWTEGKRSPKQAEGPEPIERVPLVAAEASAAAGASAWFPTAEQAVWEWPHIEERLAEDID